MGVMGKVDEHVKALLSVVEEAKAKWPGWKVGERSGYVGVARYVLCFWVLLCVIKRTLLIEYRSRLWLLSRGLRSRLSGQVHPG